jgi:uncharacterized protein YneF (UPF0154 family)
MKKIDNKIVGRIVLIVLFILVLLLLGVYIFLGFGKRKLMNNSTTTIPDMVDALIDSVENVITSEKDSQALRLGEIMTGFNSNTLSYGYSHNEIDEQ